MENKTRQLLSTKKRQRELSRLLCIVLFCNAFFFLLPADDQVFWAN